MSISNQRAFLLGYVRERGWTAAAEYADDGWSGTTFQRPAFQRLLADIEARRIDTVVTKDLSRWAGIRSEPSTIIRSISPPTGCATSQSTRGWIRRPALGTAWRCPSWPQQTIFILRISPARCAPPWTPADGGAVYRVRTSAGLPKGPGAKGTSAARPHRRLGGGTGVSDLSGSGVCAGDREGPYPGRGAHPGGLPERRGGRGVERHHGAPDPHQPHLRRAPDPAAHGKARV